jgi:DNA-directed RNA polymerase specialized sigma24 family protein
MLRHVEGLRLDEVAEAMECSLATAKRRIQRADRHVRADVRIERADDGERRGEEGGDDHSA